MLNYKHSMYHKCRACFQTMTHIANGHIYKNDCASLMPEDKIMCSSCFKNHMHFYFVKSLGAVPFRYDETRPGAAMRLYYKFIKDKFTISEDDFYEFCRTNKNFHKYFDIWKSNKFIWRFFMRVEIVKNRIVFSNYRELRNRIDPAIVARRKPISINKMTKKPTTKRQELIQKNVDKYFEERRLKLKARKKETAPR